MLIMTYLSSRSTLCVVKDVNEIVLQFNLNIFYLVRHNSFLMLIPKHFDETLEYAEVECVPR